MGAGMDKATHVLLTGIVWSGTAVVLHADSIGEMLKAAVRFFCSALFHGVLTVCCCSEKVPSLKVFKALPVEAVFMDRDMRSLW